MTFDDYSFPFFGTRRRKSLFFILLLSIIQRVNFSGGVNISLSLSLKKRNPKNNTKEENITHNLTRITFVHTQIQKSIIMEELKASGNAAFKKGDFASAVDFFTRAIDAEKTLENHHVLYSNRSAARVRCCCRRQKSSSSSFSHRFKVVSILGESVFSSSSSSSKSLVVLCVKEES